MEKKVVIFNGKEIEEISLDYFFQDPRIEGLNPVQVAKLYQETAVFANLLDELPGLIQSGSLSGIDERYLDSDFTERCHQGLYILEGMVMDLFGDRRGSKIIEDTLKDLEDAITP